MNYGLFGVLKTLSFEPELSLRALSKKTGMSLGAVSRAVHQLAREDYIRRGRVLTQKALDLFGENRPRHAVILAAGPGIRMTPVNSDVPKALLTVHGECLIERLIRQLSEAGVSDIHVVTGFMKEKFEYLGSEFGVTLIYNSHYMRRNNLHSLWLCRGCLSDAYIVPSDVWCEDNPFSSSEYGSWYMLSNAPDEDAELTIHRNGELSVLTREQTGNRMIGIAYLHREQAPGFRATLEKLHSQPKYHHSFWEEILLRDKAVRFHARVVPDNKVYEINTYEQLRDLDSNADHLQSDVIRVIGGVLDAKTDEICDINIMKKGMTNRSFLFRVRDRQYIMRISGAGSEKLLSREQEYAVYQAISGLHLSDDVIYMDPASGQKITIFWPEARVCDPKNPGDVKRCMVALRSFHEKKLTVPHSFSIYERINYFEELLGGAPHLYRDYEQIKARVLSLAPYVENHRGDDVLCHIDSVPDNFLFLGDDIRIIDWEYSAMQDPHVDIAMFAAYSLYDRDETERLIDFYFTEGCPAETRVKLHCYMALCGLMWSNWCEYKLMCGVDFGEYSLAQYRYAKEYSLLALGEIGQINASPVYLPTDARFPASI